VEHIKETEFDKLHNVILDVSLTDFAKQQVQFNEEQKQFNEEQKQFNTRIEKKWINSKMNKLK
jgi:hypothetical protein